MRIMGKLVEERVEVSNLEAELNTFPEVCISKDTPSLQMCHRRSFREKNLCILPVAGLSRHHQGCPPAVVMPKSESPKELTRLWKLYWRFEL